ncbi:MAG TPA: hypothetical protein VOB72_18915 [Candidatus Dormibacteraeota bacterium]|nr:hypothetical protein [Candidatus Dormibacteraeota bacterium]
MAGSREGFRWTVALLSAAFVLGGYVDAWSRLVPASPLGPWHDALVDVAWLAVTGFMAAALGRDLAAGVAWRAALPAGYHLALAGGLVFGLGALADVYYQIAFGVAQGLEALLAPPHLVELAAGGLLVAAPLSRALRDRPERASWPVVISAALTLSALTFLTQFAHPLVDLWSSRAWSVQVLPWVAQNLGVASILVQVSLLTGVMLLLIRSFALPGGSLTVVAGVNGICVAIVSRHPELVGVPLLTGVAADVLLLWLRPDANRTTGLRMFAAGVPALYVVLYAVAIALLEGGSAWSARLWVGVVLAAALAGFLVSYLAGIRRPRSVVAAEVWGERWPQRHVEVSPAVVKEALEALDDQAAIGASPLTRLACIAGDGSAAGPELRTLLIDVVRELAAARAPRDAEAGQLLVDYYVKRVGSHEVIAERLHLSRPTFYRRLQRGLTLAAERLDELAEFAARHA